MKRFLANLLTLLVSLALALALVEGGLRLFTQDVRLQERTIRYDAGPRFVPNQRQEFKSFEWDYLIEINGDGFRNERLRADLPDRTILVLGDSFPEGYGVAFDKTFPKVMQARALETGLAGHVYDAGLTGTAPPIFVAAYRDYFSGTPQIDTVVMTVCENDFITDPTPFFPRRLDRPSYRLKRFLNEHSAIYALVNRTIKTSPWALDILVRLGAVDRAAFTKANNLYCPDNMRDAARFTAEYLTAFARELRGGGKRFLVVLIPTREQVSDEKWNAAGAKGPCPTPDRFGTYTRFADSLRKNGVDVLDLTEPFRQRYRRTGEKLYFDLDTHWNARGHALAAELIADRLSRQP